MRGRGEEENVCVCDRERETERQRERDGGRKSRYIIWFPFTSFAKESNKRNCHKLKISTSAGNINLATA